MNYEQYKQLFNIQHPEYQEKMGKLFELYYPKEKNISEGQMQAFKEVFDNAQIIANALKPLRDLGFDFNLAIVGGAVRDIVMDRTETINDYDFVLNIDDSHPSLQILKEKITNSGISEILTRDEQSSFYRQLNSFEKYLSENQFKKRINDPYMGMSNKKIEEETKIKLLWQIIVERQVKTMQKEYTIFTNKDVENKYLNQHIEAIFQINGINNKKIDLILSERTGQGFAMTFDFEICKGVIGLDFLTNHQPFDGEPIKALVDNVWLMPSMLKDIDEKTFTIRANNFTSEHINYFMGKHFLKLKQKFPTYTLNYCDNSLKPNVETINLIKYYKAKHMHEDLQGEIPINVADIGKNDIKRIKI
jgi:hypothetical protein